MADDIVTRLHRDFGTHRHVSETDRKMVAAAADEIERLRGLGDAMHRTIRGLHLSGENRVADAFAALQAWGEARRG